jgi:hypothetical protein
MAKIVITDNLKTDIEKFLEKNKKADLITTYLHYLEKKFQLKLVIFAREKMIYESQKEVIAKLESQGKLWRETEIKIQLQQQSVNEQTTKIYICPFTGKVFGNNTHPNPQDAIYEWVSKCPENTERVNGLRVKRFFVSEDPEVIKNYIVKRKEPITKIVYSSVVTGKLFNSKAAVLEDFTQNQLKPISLIEVPGQNRYQIESGLLQFIQQQLQQENLTLFVDALSKFPEFSPYVEGWMEEENSTT